MFTISFDACNAGAHAHERFPQIINILASWRHFCVVAFIVVLTFLFPRFWTIIILPIIILSFSLAGLPFGLFKPKENSTKTLLQFLAEINVLKFFSNIHLLMYYSKQKIFVPLFILIHLLTLAYFCVSRYNFYHVVVLHEVYSIEKQFVILALLYITFAGYYFRLLVMLSTLIVMITRHLIPSLLPPILRVEPGDIPPEGPHKSIFSYTRTTHNHHYSPQPKMGMAGRAAIAGSVAGVVIAGVTLYYTHGQTLEARRQTLEARRQTLEAEKQTLEAKKQTYEFQRQNDLEELSQGIINKDQYNQRHPQDKR